MICSVYGEGAMTDRMCQSGLLSFMLDFLLDGAPWLGRPVEVDSDLIKTLIENDQPYTMWEIAYIPKTSKSIKLLVKMKNVFYFTEKTKWTFWPIQ